MADDTDSTQSPIKWNVSEKQPLEPTERTQQSARPWETSLHDAQDWFKRRKSSGRASARRSSLVLQRTVTGKKWWRFTLRPWDDDEYQDWWFAGTAIPLLAATIGPLANVFSIAALVTYWRMCLVADAEDPSICQFDGNIHSLQPQLSGKPYKDPDWCFDLNIVSLVAGFVGNFFLLCNFTGRIRYIIALPVTIIMWYIATGILIGITVSMHIYKPPMQPAQTYTEGFWYAVLAACMYAICSMILGVNMAGYFLGHYPQHFTLTESQRTLILQTMLFFFWLAGGGAMFWAVERKYGHDDTMNWSYVNALYFCDVTILTVGFGDLYTTSDLGRGLLFPYSVIGIIMLGLMVSSIAKFAAEIGSDKIIRKHVETTRARTVGRTVTSSQEFERRQTFADGHRPTISGPFDAVNFSKGPAISSADGTDKPPPRIGTLKRVATLVAKGPRQRKPKLVLLREEKDRFEAMRHIQKKTSKFKRWYALCLSVIAFGLLWCGGAIVFWRVERHVQHMTYFKALYFCYVSLLTIGYGDLAPQSNAGRPFFVLWSLIAVPTMTILISDLGDTVINKFKHGTVKVADFTVLPKYGVWRGFLSRHPWLLNWLQQRKRRREEKRRVEEGFQVGPEPDPLAARTIEQLAGEELSKEELACKLAKKVRQTADEMMTAPRKRYSYEEWVEITQLIRFTAKNENEEGVDEDEHLVEWDWIGEDSPMMSKSGEPEFVLDRLCESMHRYIKSGAVSQRTERDSPVSPKQYSDPNRFPENPDDGSGVGPLDLTTDSSHGKRPYQDSSPTSSNNS